jgi:hypothetical protein
LIVSYEVNTALPVVEAAYRAQLRASGFRLQAASTAAAGAHAWLLEREQTLAVAVLGTTADGRALLTLSPLP